MKKLLAIVSVMLLLTVACKSEACKVEEAVPVEEVKAVEEVAPAVEEVVPAESVE